jgi:hypothetical protein
MYAEALWHIGGSDNLEMGLNYLNQVRSRAGLPELLSLTPEAIMHERDVELGAEAIRFMDLIRWSKLNEPWFQLSDLENFNTGEDEFLPVLPREINFSTRRIEDGAIDSLGFFEIKHVLNYGNFTYSLIQGDGINDADNDKFYITDNILYAQAPLVYKNQPEYKILIEATDMQGETREQAFTLKLKSSTPVHEISKNEIKVFPNPVINDLNLLNASDQSAYKIYNLQGKLVKEGLFFKNTKINVHNLKSGLYILEMHTMEGYYATKFIKK